MIITNESAIKSLLHTIKCHRNYINELKTTHYRGAVTDERIALIESQIKECEDTIHILKTRQEVSHAY